MTTSDKILITEILLVAAEEVWSGRFEPTAGFNLLFRDADAGLLSPQELVSALDQFGIHVEEQINIGASIHETLQEHSVRR